MVLDRLQLSSNLNDQELLTLVRRFKDADKYYYSEMADLFAHVTHLRTGKNAHQQYPYMEVGVRSLEDLQNAAKSRSTQWRR